MGKSKPENVNVENINTVIGLIRNEQNFFTLSTYEVGNMIASFTEVESKVDHIAMSRRSYAAQQVRKYNPVCETPACIAGWANEAWNRANPFARKLSLNDSISAKRFLGLNKQATVDRLFGISISSRERDKVTREEAIYALEQLRDTGKVSSYRTIRKILQHAKEHSELHGPEGSGQDRAPDSVNG